MRSAYVEAGSQSARQNPRVFTARAAVNRAGSRRVFPVKRASCNTLNSNPLDFLKRKFLAGVIVEFGRARRFVIGDGLGVL